MKYITHNRFKKLAACGEAVNIPYGTEMETAGDFIITTEGKPICYATSEAAKMHFARNDDGQGLERGKLTWAIAYSQRARTGPNGRQQRFTEEEIELLERKWAHFLRQDVEVILFNEDFFAAAVPELKELVSLMRYSSNNLNQLTRRVHETGRIYDADLEDISRRQEALWDGVHQVLTQLAKLT